MSVLEKNIGELSFQPDPAKLEKMLKAFSRARQEILLQSVEIYPVPERREPSLDIIHFTADGQLVLPGYKDFRGTDKLVVH